MSSIVVAAGASCTEARLPTGRPSLSVSWSGRRVVTGLVFVFFATAADDVPVVGPTDVRGAGFGFAAARLCPELTLGVDGAWRVCVGAEEAGAAWAGGRVEVCGALAAAFGTAAGGGASGVGASGVGVSGVVCAFSAVVRDGRRAIPAGGASGEGLEAAPAPIAGLT
jgi:hypothetical protein